MSISCVLLPPFFSRSWTMILSTKAFRISGVNSSMRVYFLVTAISLATLVASVSASLTSAVKTSLQAMADTIRCSLSLWTRRHKFRIVHFRAGMENHSLHCSSFFQKVQRLFGNPVSCAAAFLTPVLPAEKASIHSAPVSLIRWLTFHSSIYVLISFSIFQIPLQVFQNTIVAVPMSRFWANWTGQTHE